MSSHGVAPPSTSARAAASRANGAKSQGPKTAEGKARSAQNALRHGMCAKKHVLLPDDSRAEFAALESALLEDLRPEGTVQTLLARRLVAAAWRLARADRLEFGLLAGGAAQGGPGRALIQGGRAAAAFAMLVRYRGGAQAELFRTLKLLKELQAAAPDADPAADARPEPPLAGTPGPARLPTVAALPRPAACPAPLPLREPAPPRQADAAGARRMVPAPAADATRNEPGHAPGGHRCAADAPPIQPGRPRPSGTVRAARLFPVGCRRSPNPGEA